MNLHRQLGSLFGTFSLVMFGWHILTPDNPHHLINLVLHSSLSIIFISSHFMSIRVCRYLHPLALLVGASLTAWSGNFTVAGTVSFVAFLLHFAYGGFRSISTFRVGASFIGLFSMFFLSVLVSNYGHDYAQAYAVALVWTFFTVGLFWCVWLIFQCFAAEYVQQNRDLLEQNKELTKGDRADVTKKRG